LFCTIKQEKSKICSSFNITSFTAFPKEEQRGKTLQLALSTRNLGVASSQRRNKKEAILRERRRERDNTESTSHGIHKSVKSGRKR